MGSSCIIIINSDEGELSWWNEKAVLGDGGSVDKLFGIEGQ